MRRSTGMSLLTLMNEASGLVVRLPSWMGDILMARPAWVWLRHQLNRPMVALVRSRYRRLAELFEEFDAVLAYPERPGPRRWRWFRRMKPRFDNGVWIGVTLANSLESAWELRLLGLPVRYGFRTDGRNFLLTHGMVPLRPGPRWQVEDYRRLVAAALERYDAEFERLPPIAVPDAWRAAHPLPEARYVAVHGGASKRPRRWPIARYLEVAHDLVRWGWAVHLHVDEPFDGASVADVVVHQNVPFETLAACISGAEFFLGNDAGPAHLAAALGVPTAIVYGPGHPEVHRPVPAGAPFLPIHANWPCAPCRQKFFRECPPVGPDRPACLDFIQPRDVITALEAEGWLAPRPR